MKLPNTFHEDAFYEFFTPYRHKAAAHEVWGGLGLETFGSDLQLVNRLDVDFVWTVIDSDDGGQWIVPGVHLVNRICYLVSRKPHNWIDIQFNARSRKAWLSPIGLKRQLAQLERMMN